MGQGPMGKAWNTRPNSGLRTSLVVQWLRLHAPNAGGLGSIPGQGTRSHMPQQRICRPQGRLKMLHATMKTWSSQIINKNK